jgi:hypothetical protein
VIEAEDAILVELERLAPSDETMNADWDRVLRHAGGTVERQSRGGPRRGRVLVAVAALLLAVAVPTVALSAGVRSLLGFGDSRPVVEKAQLVISAPVGNAFYAHLWHAPSTTDGQCSFLSIDRHLVPLQRPTMNGGGGCNYKGNTQTDRASSSLPLTTDLSIGRRPRNGDPARWVPPVVSGNVYPGLHAARVVVEWRGGSYELALHDGYFLGGTPRLYLPPFRDFPFYVVAYNSGGQEIARKQLDSPSLLLMNNGWKQYAREYLKWKQTRRG